MSCLNEKSLFNPSKSICGWLPSDKLVKYNETIEQNMTCQYTDQSNQWDFHVIIIYYYLLNIKYYNNFYCYIFL